MSRLVLALLGLSGLVVVAACSSKSAQTLFPEDYDSSCAVDADCTGATFGDVCELGCNPNGAFNTREADRYTADYTEKYKECPDVRYVQDPCTGLRRPHVARCTAARCTVVEVVDAGASDAPSGG